MQGRTNKCLYPKRQVGKTTLAETIAALFRMLFNKSMRLINHTAINPACGFMTWQTASISFLAARCRFGVTMSLQRFLICGQPAGNLQ